MSARLPPRAIPPTRWAFLCAAAVIGCGFSDAPLPHPVAVEPATGYNGRPTSVVIRGDGFLLRTSARTSGGVPVVDDRYRAWLGEVELDDVARVDATTLRASVPAGLHAGSHPLVVEGPFGLRGRLEDAFTATAGAAGALEVGLETAPGTVSIGQGVSLVVRVTNVGSATVIDVAPVEASVAPAAAGTLSAPSPAAVAGLAPGESATFTWAFEPSAACVAILGFGAAGTDSFSGLPVRAEAALAEVTVQRPAALSAGMTAPGSVPFGSEFAVSMTVVNSGEAAATQVEPTDLALAAGSVPATLRSGPTPASAEIRGAGGSATFVWVYVAGGTAGTLRLEGSARGLDGNTGDPVAALPATTAPIAIGQGALVATLAASPATVSLRQPITLTLHVTNPGSAPVTGVTPSVPTVTGTGGVDPVVLGPDPASIPALGPGQAGSFSWVYTASLPGSLGFAASVAGTDGFSGVGMIASASAQNVVSVHPAEALVATELTASRAVASAGQAVALTLTLRNPGTTTADVTSVAPTVAPAIGVGCTEVSPAPPRVLAPGASLTFTWSCSGSTAGSYALGAAVSAVEPVSGTDVSPSVPRSSLTVQAPAALTAVLSVGRTTAVTGQPIDVSLAVRNTGGATAIVSAVKSSVAPVAGAACTAPALLPSVSLEGGASATFTWTCTATVAGSYSLGAGVTATDANSGAGAGATALPVPVAVQAPEALSVALFSASRTVADVGQPVTFSLQLLNVGGSSATVSSVVPEASPVGATCGPVEPGAPQAVPGGGSVTFRWTCSASAAGSYQVGGTVTASDPVTGADLSPRLAPISLAVQVPAALRASLSASSGTGTVGLPIKVTLKVEDTGGATADVSAVTPSLGPPSGGTCTVVAPAPPLSVPGGSSASFGWSCTPATAGSLALGASVLATDANTGAGVETPVAPVPVVVTAPSAQLGATLTASATRVPVGQSITLTLAVANTGTGAATVSAVTPASVPAAGMTCTAAAPVPPQTVAAGTSLTFTWTCSPTAGGTYSLGAAVVAADAGSGADASPAVAALPVTADAPAALRATTFSVSPATVAASQPATVTLTLANAGGAPASVTGLKGSIVPAAKASCTAAVPAPPQTIAAGASLTFAWTCSASNPRGYTLDASVTASDAVSGASIGPAVPAITLTVQAAAAPAP